MRALLRLLVMDLQTKMRDKKVILLITCLILFYGAFSGVNLTNSIEISERLSRDETDGMYLRVPLVPPIKTYSYFDNFIAFQTGKLSQEKNQAGFILLPDKLEDANNITWSSRLLLLFSGLVMIFLGHNELSIKNTGLLTAIFTAITKKRSIFTVKVMAGAVCTLFVFLADTSFLLLLTHLRGIKLISPGFAQLVWYNIFYCLFLFTVYNLTLALSATSYEHEASKVLFKSMVILLVMIFIIPTFLDSFTNFILHKVGRESRLVWYWSSRYLYFSDPVSSFGELTTDVLYINRAKVFYASLPWTHSIAILRDFGLCNIFLINWFKIFTLSFWALGSYLWALRRWAKSNVC